MIIQSLYIHTYNSGVNGNHIKKIDCSCTQISLALYLEILLGREETAKLFSESGASQEMLSLHGLTNAQMLSLFLSVFFHKLFIISFRVFPRGVKGVLII